VIGLVLGPLFEWRFAQSMSLANGNILVFLERPISATLIGLAVAGLSGFAIASIRRKRQEKAAGSPD
jgi:putative tricarboxylic transport membrane protein